jgi:trans-aconitate methyltransferase
MFAALNRFLGEHFAGKPLSLVDLGCGDSSSISVALGNIPLRKYTGIDAATDVLKLSADQLASLPCEKEFICDDMLQGALNLKGPFDVIFTSYALHHLSLSQKIELIQTSKDKLTENGCLIMVDGIRKRKQTREEWLDALEARFKFAAPQLSAEELQSRMQHPRADDYPEELDTFENIAKEQQWSDFRVLVKKGICAFVVFAK